MSQSEESEESEEFEDVRGCPRMSDDCELAELCVSLSARSRTARRRRTTAVVFEVSEPTRPRKMLNNNVETTIKHHQEDATGIVFIIKHIM